MSQFSFKPRDSKDQDAKTTQKAEESSSSELTQSKTAEELGLKKLYEINILDNDESQMALAMWSLAILVVGVVIALSLAGFAGLVPTGWRWWVALIVVHLVSLPLHEIIHAVGFKILGPDNCLITMGFESGMLYTRCTGGLVPRERFLMIILAPCVILTLVFIALGVILSDPLFAWCQVMLHLSGCTGDLYYTRVVAQHPRGTLCEDTDTGMTLWAPAD